MQRLKLPVWLVLLAAGGGATVAGASTNPPRWHAVEVQAKAQAERNVLAAVPRRLTHSRIRVFIDRRTGLLKNNVQAVCHGRGVRIGTRHERFVCSVRTRGGHARLVFAYRALPGGRFRLHRLAFHRR